MLSSLDQSGKEEKLFCGLTDQNLTFLLETMDVPSSVLKMRGTILPFISAQVKSLPLWWYRDALEPMAWTAYRERHHHCRKVQVLNNTCFHPAKQTQDCRTAIGSSIRQERDTIPLRKLQELLCWVCRHLQTVVKREDASQRSISFFCK